MNRLHPRALISMSATMAVAMVLILSGCADEAPVSDDDWGDEIIYEESEVPDVDPRFLEMPGNVPGVWRECDGSTLYASNYEGALAVVPNGCVNGEPIR